MQVQRTIKVTPLPDGMVLVAIEVLPGDLLSKSMSKLPDFRVALVRNDRLSPAVTFLVTPLSELASGLHDELDYYRDLGVNMESVRKLTDGIEEIKSGLTTVQRRYPHGAEWRQKIECLEQAIPKGLRGQGSGVVIIHDLADSDENARGFAVIPGEEMIIGIVGEVYRNGEGSKFPYWCKVRTERWPSETDVLAQYMRKPLLWRVDCSAERGCVLARDPIWCDVTEVGNK